MTTSKQMVLWRGVTAGTLLGLAIGGMIALVIAMKPELFAGLIQQIDMRPWMVHVLSFTL